MAPSRGGCRERAAPRTIGACNTEAVFQTARALTISVLSLGLFVAGALTTEAAPSAQVEDPRPNIVLILTDDMRLGDLDRMPRTQKLVGQLRVTRFLSNHPMCCPARAEIITGQFGHHNGVFHNTGPFGGDHALIGKDNTLASWLYDAGYRTCLSGKWLNGWEPRSGSTRPYGWTHFNPWIRNIYSPYGYTSWNDGHPVKPGIHTNDAVTRSAVRQIRESGDEPVFVYASYIAPHGMFVDGRWVPPVPAPRHRDMFSNAVPSYQDKPSFDYGPKRARTLRRVWRQRLRSLQSVDEGVSDIASALRDRGELGSTVLIFASDNGYLLGEHRVQGKNLPWEEALRVPLLARGPGLPSGTTGKVGMMADLAPSIARLAGVTPRRQVDGRADLFTLGGGWREVLIQAGSDNHAKHFSWRGTRTPRWTYVHWVGGRKQLFDRKQDPYQLHNLAGKRPKVEAGLARRTPDPY